MMMCMNEADYESQRDEIRCGGYKEPNQGGEYGSQYSAAALYDGGWRSVDIPEMIALYKLSDEEAEQIANLNSIIKMQADRIKELEEGVESSASRVMALENENVHLKARLYDILMK